MPRFPDSPKGRLRRQILRRRRALYREDPARLALDSARLCAHVLADPRWAGTRGLAAFVGVRGEPQTQALLQATLDAGKALWLPRVDGPVMTFWRVPPGAGLAVLERRSMGLLEPPPVGESSPMPGPAEGVDLVVVPGLAFSRAGERLGFGAGHYDRAFGGRWSPAQWSAGAGRPFAMAACFSAFIDPEEGEVPREAHDVVMDALVSEAGVMDCG